MICAPLGGIEPAHIIICPIDIALDVVLGQIADSPHLKLVVADTPWREGQAQTAAGMIQAPITLAIVIYYGMM